MKTIVFIDFDKTLYKKDSLLTFTKFYKGSLNFYKGLFVLSPFLILYKLNFLSGSFTKKKYLNYFFKNDNYSFFCKKGKEFALNEIDKHLDQILLSQIKEYKKNKATIYIVTASFDEWIKDWANKYEIVVISTKLEILENKITGKFSTKNCNGIEKVNRINNEINLTKFDKIIAIGNGKGDKEMVLLNN